MSLRWRLVAIVGVVAWLAFLAVSNFVPAEERAGHWYLPDDGLRLGLDLQGGIHWVLGVKLDVAVKQELDYLQGLLDDAFEEEKIGTRGVSIDGGQLVVEAVSPTDATNLRQLVTEEFTTLEIDSQEDQAFRLRLSDEWTREVRERGMRQVLEVMRRRIDDPQTGIPESVVTRQGADRILVQIPGGEVERERARNLLHTTGYLEFMIVEGFDTSEELLLARYPDGLPEGKQVLPQRDPLSNNVTGAYLLDESPAITGKYLVDARVGFDNRQRPIVNFTWSSEGAKIFADLTEKNIGKQLAIVLDDRVESAPEIQSRISGHGQITGRFTMEEVSDLSTILRAGSLSVPAVIEEERTVGPALGADSVRRGLRACLLGLVFVVAFTIGYYRLSGGYASLALLANLTMVIGLMSLFGATLTLPGMAGLVLTVGMAVDANVIIFERIREELRAGKTPRAAIATGFSKSLWTILDANITTLITAIVLFEFGTGPIKGFAVTLSIGILTSVFAAMVITRVMFAVYPGSRTVPALSI